MTLISKHVEQYIEIVEQGKQRASKENHALVRRIRQCLENEPIHIDDALADKYLGLAKYFPWPQIFPWQEFVITLHLCTFWNSDNTPRWPSLLAMIGRGAGKDGLIALESVSLVSPYNGIRAYDVDICANNEEQALRPVLDIVDAFENGGQKAKLEKYYKWLTESVKGKKTGGIIRGRTNNPKGKDGMRSGMVVFNEIHQYENYLNLNVFTTGLGKHPHPRRLYVTTNGDVQDGPLDDLLQTSEGILFGGEPDNGLLPFICRLDNKDEVHDEANWEKANPSLPYLDALRLEMETEYREWVQTPARHPAFLTKRMNIRDGTGELRVTDYENIKLTNQQLPDLDGWNCVAGIDFSKTTDWVSVCLHFKRGNDRYDIVHSWVCKESRDLPLIKAPWREWVENGRLTLIDDVEVHPEIIGDYLSRMRKKYKIQAIAIDDFRFTILAQELARLGYEPKKLKNLKCVRPSDIMKIAPVIESCFANHYFTWGDSPELRWAVNNTKLIRFGRTTGEDIGNYVYAKIEAKSRKTDPFMALVAAMTIEDRIIERRGGSHRHADVITF